MKYELLGTDRRDCRDNLKCKYRNLSISFIIQQKYMQYLSVEIVLVKLTKIL